MYKLLGYGAAGSWFALSGITVAGLATGSMSLLFVNLAMASVFALVALFLIWRTMTFVRLGLEMPESSTVAALRRIEVIANLSMFALGVLCSFAAAMRVIGEGLAVFG